MRSLVAVFSSALLLYAANGLQGVLMPLAGTVRDFSTVVLGLLGSAYAGGFVIGCLTAAPLLRRVGHIRAFSVLGAVLAITVLGYTLTPQPLTWLGLRAVSGLTLAGLFTVIESWLNASASNAVRGRVLSFYLIINSGSLMVGQLGVGLAPPSDETLFVVVAIGVCLATLPVGLTTTIGPAPVLRVSLRLGRLYRLSPVGMVGGLLIGMANGAFTFLAVVFLSDLGFTPLVAAGFVSSAMLGGVLVQMPVGWVSDRIDRRLVVIALALWATIFALALWASTGNGPASLAIAATGLHPMTVWTTFGFMYGIAAFPLYGVVAAHVNDLVDPDSYVEASGGLLLTWGLGATAGPIAAAALMQRFAANALFMWIAIVFALLAIYAVWRTRSSPAPKTKRRASLTGIVRPTPMATVLGRPEKSAYEAV
ncbi:MFS transporter [Ferruginivarius sediminum]|uniref:MFS transporter n=1 Tax=Ferruginivarius sediminum TaxID=2661937 RepID=A0A369T792_9PROT|nr:MFS transporter [Ferruginivarius sediminum]RDD61193.1 MFS transporter [Ferruginivarius sediminum]